ncbi:alpha/beta hydrolase [Desulfosarcina sp.]|uniref:alpha/beta hydrolase n=1 Tax=Desulfosarcina sp. TaxID=2027861 RepID=UPI0039705BFA
MEQQIQFDNHVGETLSGTLHQPELKPVGAVVAGHCFTCSRHTGVLRHICGELCEAGFSALRFDFSGNGQSQGRFEQSTWSKQILEMESAIALMQTKGAPWIGLAGHSLGAAIALLAARRIKAVSAVCRIAGRVSATRPLHFLTPEQQQTLEQTGLVNFASRGRKLALNRDFFEDAHRYDLKDATRSLTIPMLVVHGDRDAIIPVSEAHLAKATNPDKVDLTIIPGGDHMLAQPDHQRQVARMVTDWFRRQVGVSEP